MSPSTPPVGAEVETVRVPEALVPTLLGTALSKVLSAALIAPAALVVALGNPMVPVVVMVPPVRGEDAVMLDT